MVDITYKLIPWMKRSSLWYLPGALSISSLMSRRQDSFLMVKDWERWTSRHILGLNVGLGLQTLRVSQQIILVSQRELACDESSRDTSSFLVWITWLIFSKPCLSLLFTQGIILQQWFETKLQKRIAGWVRRRFHVTESSPKEAIRELG